MNYLLKKIQMSYENDKKLFFLIGINYVLIFGIFSTILLFSSKQILHYIPIVLSVLLSICTFLLILYNGKIYINYYVLSLISFILYAIIISFITSSSLSTLKTFVNVYLLALVLIQFIINSKNINVIFFLLFLSVSLFSLVYFLTYSEEILSLNFSRFGATFNNENTVGSFFNIGIILCVYFMIEIKRFRFLFILPSLLFFLFTVTTGSRGAILVSMFSLVVGFYFLFPLKQKKYYILLIIFLSILFIALLNLPFFNDYKKRFTDIFSPVREASAMIRFNMIKDGLFIWLKNILFGSGIYSFAKKTHYNTYSHSALIELLVNFGLIGTLLFYIPPFMTLLFKKNNEHFSFRFIFIFSNYVLASFFFVMYYSKVFVIAVALLASSDFLNNIKKQSFLTISFIREKPYIIFVNKKINNKIKKEKILAVKFSI